MSSSRCATRLGFVAKRGSSARSGKPDDRGERPEEPVVRRRDDELPVGGIERLVRDDRRERRTTGGRHEPRAEEAGQVICHVAECGLVERHVHLATGARPLALVQRRQDRHRRPHPRALVDEGHARAHPGPAGLAGDADDPAGGLCEGVVARSVAPRTRSPERADRAVDEPGVPFAQLFCAQPALGGEPGPQALHEHVRPSTSRSSTSRPRRRSMQTDRLPAFIARKSAPSPAQNGGPQAAGLVAAAGRLDLDHVGAQRRPAPRCSTGRRARSSRRRRGCRVRGRKGTCVLSEPLPTSQVVGTREHLDLPSRRAAAEGGRSHDCGRARSEGRSRSRLMTTSACDGAARTSPRGRHDQFVQSRRTSHFGLGGASRPAEDGRWIRASRAPST